MRGVETLLANIRCWLVKLSNMFFLLAWPLYFVSFSELFKLHAVCLYITVRSGFEILRNSQKSKLNKHQYCVILDWTNWTAFFAWAFAQ